MADERPEVATMRRGVAVGRPEKPESPLGRSMVRYKSSTRRPCGTCGEPTWYGPGLMSKIAEGATASCGDCAFAALVLGARPSSIEHLGGEAVDDVR